MSRLIEVINFCLDIFYFVKKFKFEPEKCLPESITHIMLNLIYKKKK